MKDGGHLVLAANGGTGGQEGVERDRLLHTKAILKHYFSPGQALPRMSADAHIWDMPKDAKELAKLLNEAIGTNRGVNARLAEACGVSIQAVGQWRKTGRVAKKHLSTIADVLGKPITYFFPSEGKQKVPHAAEGLPQTQQQDMEQRLLMYFRALAPEFKQAMLQQANEIYQAQYKDHPQPAPSFPAQIEHLAPRRAQKK